MNALYGVLLLGVLQGLMVEGQQTTAAKPPLLSPRPQYLTYKRDQARPAPNDGDEIPGGFTPLPPLGPPGLPDLSAYGPPGFHVLERPPFRPQFDRLRPKPVPFGGLYGPPTNFIHRFN